MRRAVVGQRPPDDRVSRLRAEAHGRHQRGGREQGSDPVWAFRAAEDVIEPSDSGVADARALRANCGVSNIMGSSGSPEAEQHLLEGAVVS